MRKNEFAKELLIEELKREKGKFITQRIIDRLVLLYSPLFDRTYLTQIADNVNKEYNTGPVIMNTSGALPEKTEELETARESRRTTKVTRKLAAVVNSLFVT